jgi:plasmid stabilization system protein ParE
MPYSIFITPNAARDLQAAIDYYNEQADDLGYRFADLIEKYLERISNNPTASSERYKNIRCKPMSMFPYLIMFTVEELESLVIILRIFNTYQEPHW